MHKKPPQKPQEICPTVVITTVTSQQKQVQGNKPPKSFYSGGRWLKKAEGKEEGRGKGRSQGTKWKLFLLECGQLSSCLNPRDVLDAPPLTVFAVSLLRLPASRVLAQCCIALWMPYCLEPPHNCAQAWSEKTHFLLSRFCINFKESFKDSSAQVILSAPKLWGRKGNDYGKAHIPPAAAVTLGGIHLTKHRGLHLS